MLFLRIKNFLADFLFPKYCLGCRRYGSYLCQDCLSTLDFPTRPIKKPFTIYFAADYRNSLVEKMVKKYKNPPFARQLATELAFVIITYFNILEKKPDFLEQKDHLLIPVPLFPARKRWRGFNQSSRIMKIIAGYYGLPFSSSLLKKRRKTKPQTGLPLPQRKRNLESAFFCPKPEEVRDKKIIIFDDTATTLTTLTQAHKTLKRAGADEVKGLVIAKG